MDTILLLELASASTVTSSTLSTPNRRDEEFLSHSRTSVCLCGFLEFFAFVFFLFSHLFTCGKDGALAALIEAGLLEGADRKKFFPSLRERGLVGEEEEDSDEDEEEETIKKATAEDYPAYCQFCDVKLRKEDVSLSKSNLCACFAQHYAHDCEFFIKRRVSLKSLDCAKNK
jgi:hypothetical protein